MKNILITGASSGIGLACAEEAARRNFIVLAGHRKDSDGEKLKKLNKNIYPIKIDVTQEEDRVSCFELIEKEYGKLDCLFNNAGISASGSAEFQSIENYRRQMEVNFIAPVALTQLMLPLLRKTNEPRIIFTSSAAGILAKPMMASYSASKFALESFADTLRLELAKWGFKISILEPGKVKTQIYQKSLEDALKQFESMHEEEKILYKELIEVAMYNLKNADSMSSPVEVVVKAFMHALTNKKPKIRYPVGGDAASQAFAANWLSDHMKDKMILSKVNKFLKASQS